MSPRIFNGVKLRGVGRQLLDLNSSPGAGNVVADNPTAMNRSPIPEDQQLARNVTLKVSEKLHDLQTFDAAGIKLEVKLPKNQTADERKAFPIESLLQERGLAAWRPRPCPSRLSAQPAFIDKNNQPALPLRLFLMPATSHASIAALLARCVQWLAVPDADS